MKVGRAGNPYTTGPGGPAKSRPGPVSERTIEAVSNALVLCDGERRHAQRLAQRSAQVEHDRLSADLRRMVHAMHATPTLVLDYAWDVVFANAAARAVFVLSDDGIAPGSARRQGNVLDDIFLDPGARQLFIQWELVAQSMLETFRFRLTPHLENRRARRLVNSLYGASVREQSGWQILDAPERNREDDDVVPARSGNANIALSGRCPARCRTLKIRGASAAAVRRSRVRATFAHL